MSGTRFLAVAAVALGAALIALALRRRFEARLVAATIVLLLGGTLALDLLARPLPVAPALSFLLAAAALTCALPDAGRRTPRVAPLMAAAAAFAGAAALSLGGPGPFAWAAPHLLATLFGSRAGLLFFTPVLWLGLMGLAAWLRRDRGAAAPAALAAALFLALHALAPAERPREALAGLLPLLAPGVAFALGAMRAGVRRAPAAPLWAAGFVAVAWNVVFMQQYASGMIPRDFPVPFATIDGNAAGLVARTVGAPSSWPANWIFALRHGVGPERFDAVEGKGVPRAPGGAAVIDVGQPALDAALLLEGWSVRHACGGDAVCRAVDGSARLLLPVDGAPTTVRVRASGLGWLRVGDGRPLPLPPLAGDLDFDLGRPGRGWYAATVEVSPGGTALVDRLTVQGARP